MHLVVVMHMYVVRDFPKLKPSSVVKKPQKKENVHESPFVVKRPLSTKVIIDRASKIVSSIYS